MAAVQKQDSNVSGLRWSVETSIGVADGSAVWAQLEPNEYDDFGGQYSLVARNPINSGRQRRKGTIVDLDASGGIMHDLTQTGIQDLMQGFMFADFRRKGEEAVTAVDVDAGNPDEYEVASTTGFVAGYLIKGSGFTNAANNAMNLVTAVVASTTVEVATGLLVTEASPPAGAKITVVGYQGAAGTIDVLNAGAPALPRLVSASGPDWTTLGLIPGEWIYVGGDTAGTNFNTAANIGFARIYSISATELVFDKTVGLFVTEDNSATNNATVRLFFGRVVKNESATTSQVRRSYQLERTLGASDDASPSQIQSEYLVGAIANELVLSFNTADKIEAALNFIGTNHEKRTGATGVKAGTRPTLSVADAFNTSNDFARLKIALLDRTAGANPTALFGQMTEFELTVNNNVKPNKALATLGAFDMTAGQFEVGGSATAYFANVTALNAVSANSDVTMDAILVKNNAGIAIDIPLIALGDARLEVEQDEPILLPLEMPAAADSVFDHTLLMVFFDYLPSAA